MFDYDLHRLHTITLADVQDEDTFQAYCHQRLGVTPARTVKDLKALRTNLKQFFADNPRATWTTAGRLVDWCVAKREHPYGPGSVLKYLRSAMKAGYLPELDPLRQAEPVSWTLQSGLDYALQVETDPWWREMLENATGTGKKQILASWRESRSTL